MSRQMLILLLSLLMTLPGLPALPAQAQGGAESCPTYITDALKALDTTCAATGRNEACYGNTQLTAAFWPGSEPPAFSAPADRVNVALVQTLTGSALQPDVPSWGLGVLQLQANIPDTLPGQNVTFLLVGDVTIQNQVAPEDARAPVTPVDVTASTGVNLRAGPGTNFSLVGSITAGTTLPATGLNEAGDWVQVIQADGQQVWLARQFVQAAGDLATLPVTAGEVPLGPLQAFAFSSGLSAPNCPDSLPDHLLVHSPEGVEVTFEANGVHFSLGSTVALRRPTPDKMTVTTFEGRAVLDGQPVQGNPFTLVIPAGLEADLPLTTDAQGNPVPAGPPTDFRPLDPAEWSVYSGLPGGLALAGNFSVPDISSLPGAEALAAATSGVLLGTGDVQITLFWNNLADMDLIVEEPGGNAIYFGAPVSPDGGQLDVDSNYPCGENTHFAENVYWPTGQAPRGSYTVAVNQYDTCGAGDAAWTLVVRVEGNVVLTRSGVGGYEEFTFER